MRPSQQNVESTGTAASRKVTRVGWRVWDTHETGGPIPHLLGDGGPCSQGLCGIPVACVNPCTSQFLS